MAIIERVEVRVIEGGWRCYTLITVIDKDGAVGYGEATLKEKHLAVAQAVMDLGQRILGKEARDIERIWHELYISDHWRGGPVYNSAISSIEMALWDLLGQSAGLPVWRLMGGKMQPDIRLYANGWFRGTKNDEELLEAALKTVSTGFTALKWNPFLPAFQSGQADTPAGRLKALENAAEMVSRVRKQVGPDVDLLIECHGMLTKEEALFLCQAIAATKPLFVEEPIHPANIAGLSWLSDKITVPLAGGERWFTRWDVLPIINQVSLAVLQTDLCHCGGMGELKKIAALAEAAHIQMAPHNSAGPLATIANAQVMVTCPNFLILEVFFNDIAWTERFIDSETVIKNGTLQLAETPGLGVRLNPDIIKKHIIQTMNTESR